MIYDISSILTSTFDEMDRIFTSYVVMNKYDELPESLPSDIDIAIPVSDYKKLDYLVGQIGKATSLVITQKIWHNYRKCAYILTPLHVTGQFRLQLDFFADFSVKSTPLLIPADEMQRKTRTYGRFKVPDFDMEFVFLFMRRVYKDDFDEEHCEILRNVLMQDIDRVKAYAKKYFTDGSIEYVAVNLMEKKYTSIQKYRSVLWKELKKTSADQSRGIYWLNYWADQFKRTVFRVKYPVGMSIAFLSPDGGGKSTIIEQIGNTCWGTFHYKQKKYFRPRLFKNLGHYNVVNPTVEASTNSDPHGVKPDGFVKSFVRFMFYNLDFVVGNLLVRKAAVQKYLTVFDRYYYDYYVDTLRYKYCFSNKIPKMFTWMIPEPDITFILDAPAEVLYARKKELPLDELQRQIVEYRKIAPTLKNAKVINVDRPIDEIVDDVTKEILLYKAKEVAVAMKLNVDETTGVIRGGNIY